ncbi:MMPL family transporter [Saccharomonospora viridis]|uniref:Predicted RND superfamily drug exporter n=1 Tax=Saccharomonospora viridis (strain ATCC 15386 / DSM 43017 / JCM 3036 / CCUG 5913 / NBRC 12207 / NCIMB 9602 / P101) TaxID=471857 RepID=C7MYJ7_SACVD|nr:MMPL family transporter [Saccharomonospora viridis]ACU97416.1 predicted RND superfamily drug exporter [Saccharomonospora viridis DSM 43017]
MATWLYRLGRFAFRRRGLVALLWIVVLAAVGGATLSTSSTASTSISIPGTEAQQAAELMEERFPGSKTDGATARVVLQAPDGEQITAPEYQAAIGDVAAELAQGKQVQQVIDPFQGQTVSPDQTIAYIQVNYDASPLDLTDETRAALEDAAESAREAGLVAEIGGDALFTMPETGITEVIGVIVAAVVLLITFGSLVAAGLPLITALIGVGISVGIITVLTGVLELDSTTPILATMIGLAVGIDYALFIVSRYRAELAEGHEPLDAVGRATGTAGSAVVFAGLTVIIALACLFVVNIPILTKMGLAAAGAVVFAVLVALTLIPALIGFAGKRLLPRKQRNGDAQDAEQKPRAGTRWARFVLRHRLPVLVVSIAALGVIAIPATDLQLGLPDDGAKSTDSTQRRAYDLIAQGFGPGTNGPLIVLVDAQNSDDPQAAADATARALQGLDNVAIAMPATFNPAGDTAMLTVIPASAPSSAETETLVHDIRAEAGDIADATGANVLVTGQTAMGIDVSQKLDDALMPYLLLVVGLAFVLLMVVFRSILVPLKAALGFLLSVIGALGAVVAVFQWGWLADLFGVEQTGPVMSLMPIILVGLVFGLAMDYEVFLVTRMREAYVHGESAHEAIVTGFKHGARVVTAAALIMISVFAGFIGSDESMIKMIGFGLAIAVLFDAFVVRMTIVPAVLALLGKAAWWFPRPLDKFLPNVDVEGERLRHKLDDTEPAKKPEAAAHGS